MIAGIFSLKLSKLSFSKFSITSTGTSYGNSQSTTAKDNSLDIFTTLDTSELLIILILPAASSTFVERIPISITVPRKSLIVIISPTLYSFSNIINIPATTSAIKLWQPKPITRVRIPTDAKIAVALTPTACNTKMIIAIAHAYLTSPSIKVRIVFARFDFCILLWNIILTSLHAA